MTQRESTSNTKEHKQHQEATTTCSSSNSCSSSSSSSSSSNSSSNSSSCSSCSDGTTPLAGLVFMALLAVQFGMQPILTRAYVSPVAIKSSLVLVCEALKFSFAFLVLLLSRNFRRATQHWTLFDSIMVAGFPATIYALQNVFIQMAYQNLTPVTFQLLNQIKTLFTALFLYILLGRKQSKIQLTALVLLTVAGITLTTDSSSTPEIVTQVDSFESGILPALAASLMSGIATALSQRALVMSSKYGRPPRDSSLFSMELATFTMICLALSLLWSSDGARIASEGFFMHWDLFTFVPIITNALGGLVVGQVTKRAGAVRKGFSIVAGILLTALVSSALQYQIPSLGVVFALPLVIFSTLLHSAYPYKDHKE